MSRVRAVVGGLALAATLSGCVGLHADSTITPGLEFGPERPERVVYLPPGPQANASAEATIRGFLRAAAVSGEGITVARSFLTDSLAETWKPDAHADIVEEGIQGPLRQIGSTGYELSGALVGTVDASGRLVPAPADATITVRIGLVREAGQWRISELPDGFGRWLSRGAFSQLMSAVDLHYLAGDDLLVPDVRYLVSDSLATRLAQAQLGPIPGYLTGAVSSDLTGLRLLVDAVTVADGVASVDFAAARVSPDPAARRGMWGQLVATVTQAPTVTHVAVTVEGASLDLQGLAPPVAAPEDVGFREAAVPATSLPLLRLGTALYPLDPARLSQGDLDTVVEKPSEFPDVGTQFTDIAMTPTGTEIAAVGGGELARFRRGMGESVPNFGSGLTGPAYDPDGWLWVAGRAGVQRTGAIWVLDGRSWPPGSEAAAPRPLLAPWLAERRPVAIALSADGARAAVISTDTRGRGPRLEIAGVLRDAAGAPTALAAEPLRLAPSLTRITDVAWIGATEVAVLASSDTEAVAPHVVTLGQQVRPLPVAPGAEAITTLGGERRIVVTTADGLLLRAGGTWQRVGVGDDLVVAGR